MAGSFAGACGPPTPNLFTTAVLTQHNNAQRTGANTGETVLNTTNVRTADFGKIWEYPVRGRIYAQPLFATIMTVGKRISQVTRIAIVATAENMVYAFDADQSSPSPLWQFDAGPPALAARIYHDVGQNITPTIGIIGTPVIDLVHSTVYFVAMTQPDPERDDFAHTLHALDLRNGQPRGSRIITGTIDGGGDFNSRRQNQRAALALVNDRLYVSWASFGDQNPFDGLVMSYSTMDTPKPLEKRHQFQVARFDPIVGERHKGGGIWHSGGGPAVDRERRFLYVVTGNGDSHNEHAGSDFDSSTVKLDLDLNPIDYFTPSNQDFLNDHDLDLSVAGPMIPDDQPDKDGRLVSLLVHGSKAGYLYVLNRDGLGRFHDDHDHVLQAVRVFPDGNNLGAQLEPSHIHTTPVYWRSPDGPRVYAGSDYNLGIRALAFDHEKLNPTPVATSFFPRAPISQMSLSSSGSTPGTGILWVISSPTGTVASYPGILYAFDAETLEMLYSSETNPFDRLGDYPRFNAPTIADGKVFVPTFTNKLVVYGLCSKNPRSACQCQVCQHR
jgi:outer membrane protein assembly factor BamB